jgi:hypothetical protein
MKMAKYYVALYGVDEDNDEGSLENPLACPCPTTVPPPLSLADMETPVPIERMDMQYKRR